MFKIVMIMCVQVKQTGRDFASWQEALTVARGSLEEEMFLSCRHATESDIYEVFFSWHSSLTWPASFGVWVCQQNLPPNKHRHTDCTCVERVLEVRCKDMTDLLGATVLSFEFLIGALQQCTLLRKPCLKSHVRVHAVSIHITWAWRCTCSSENLLGSPPLSGWRYSPFILLLRKAFLKRDHCHAAVLLETRSKSINLFRILTSIVLEDNPSQRRESHII